MSTRPLRPTSPAALTVSGVVGLLAGWLLRRVADEWWGSAPVVTWVQPGTLSFVAVVVGAVAWSTWRSVQVRGSRLPPHQAVNRLVLARACALVGALVAGGYLGYAISWLGLPAELAEQRILRSVVAGVAGLLVMGLALALERACRVPPGDDEE